MRDSSVNGYLVRVCPALEALGGNSVNYARGSRLARGIISISIAVRINIDRLTRTIWNEENEE